MRKLFHIIYTAVIVVALAYCIFMAGRIYEAQKWIDMREQQQKEQIKTRLKYHGIPGAICQGDKCWFYREGKRCRL